MLNNKFKILIDVNDIVGKQFNKLKVIKYDHSECQPCNTLYKKHYIHHYYLCECQCEKKTLKIVERYHLLNGQVKSCGCILEDFNKINSEKLRKDYNAFGRKFHDTWKSMKHRCTDPKNMYYKDYGGRGITIDPEWFDFKNFYRDMFESFMEHMEKYGKWETTLDRIDVNGNYCKENCRWATRKEQANNTRRTQRFSYQGKMYTARELYENFEHDPSITAEIIYDRCQKHGYTVENALNTPIGGITPYHFFKYKNNQYGTRDLYKKFADSSLKFKNFKIRCYRNKYNYIVNNEIVDERIFGNYDIYHQYKTSPFVFTNGFKDDYTPRKISPFVFKNDEIT